MTAMLELRLAGEPVHLLADRALYWPARRRLVIADLHLGKGDTLRAAGIAIPSGGSAHDLARLDLLLAQTGADALWILGDMLHGPRIVSAWRPHWLAFRARHPHLDITLVAGNHDRVARQAGLGIVIVDGEAIDAPFAFVHAPDEHPRGDGLHRLCGHLHPVVRLPGIAGRHPAFAVTRAQTVLPAFSAFTGGWRLHARTGLHCVACVGGEAVALSGGVPD